MRVTTLLESVWKEAGVWYINLRLQNAGLPLAVAVVAAAEIGKSDNLIMLQLLKTLGRKKGSLANSTNSDLN